MNTRPDESSVVDQLSFLQEDYIGNALYLPSLQS